MKNISMIWFLIAVIPFFVSCNKGGDTYQEQSPYNEELLVSVTELLSMLDEEILIIDTRTSRDAYLEESIPGAIYFHSRSDLNDLNSEIENFLIDAQQFEQRMRELGVDNDSRIVIYDEGNGLGSARLFYALEYYGFQGKASLLNGGFAAWKHEDGTVVQAAEIAETTRPGSFTSRIIEDRQCDIAYVTGVEPGSNKIIFDVRSRDEYDGIDVRADRGGHIPGAVHLEWREVLVDGDIPYFRTFAEIDEIYTSLGITRDKEIIPHCQTNIRGSHAYFTLRLMGYDSIRPYEGSWAEYGNRSEVAIVQ